MSPTNAVIEELFRRARLPELVGPQTWSGIRGAFPGESFERWVDGLERMTAGGIGGGAVIDYARGSIAAAKSVGTEATLAIVPSSLTVGRSAGQQAASALLRAMGVAAARLKDGAAFRKWLGTMERLAEHAPESVEPLLERLDFLLTRLDADGLRTWVTAGIRSAGNDAAKREKFFSLADETSLQGFERGQSDVLFVHVERRMKAYLAALWGLHPAMRTAAPRPGGIATRRTSFDGRIIRVPEIFGGYHGRDAVAHYRAALAHVGAHMVFTREKFPTGSLKPIQIALVSLIEDARVEALAAREFPGLRLLWQRYHVAQPQNALTAEILMPRLARALIEPAYRDDDPWVNKGKAMFFDHRSQWEDPAISRRIGGLLGNDIGQMRIQFNAKTYVVQPSYRDDNSGLWDHGEPPPEQAESAETILDAVRIERRDEPDARRKDDVDPEGGPANRAAQMRAVSDDQGIPVAQYPEWNYVSANEMPEWTTVLEFQPRPAPLAAARALTDEHPGVVARITRLVRQAKISQPVRLRRQLQGDRLDLDASIRNAIDRRSGEEPDPRLFETRVMRSRDLSVLALLDISESTRDRIRDTTTTVISVERAAVALLAEAMSSLGDPFAIRAFCSNGREEVRSYRVKDFGHDYDDSVRKRLAGLRGGLSTRLGAALRHAGHEISGCRSHRRLVLVLSDGEPMDVDIRDPRYFVEDARKAVQDLAHRGIDVFCVGLGQGGEKYLSRIFGRRGFAIINRVEALPEKLSMLYFRLTV